MLADILGSSISYEIVGDGASIATPIVFVHGLGGTGNVWHSQRTILQKTCKVVTLDLPGSGRSSKSETTYSMERWADQVVALADHLKFDRFVLVGHSMSTILAQKAAGKYPSKIAGLVLCGPMTELPPAGKEAFAKRIDAVKAEGMAGVADLVLGGALSPASREGNAALAGLFREVLMSNTPANYIAQVGAILTGSAKADQANIKCPTLILVGDQDAVTPLSNARAIAAAVPTAKIRIVPATAHLTMAERPELFNAMLLEFLNSL